LRVSTNIGLRSSRVHSHAVIDERIIARITVEVQDNDLLSDTRSPVTRDMPESGCNPGFVTEVVEPVNQQLKAHGSQARGQSIQTCADQRLSPTMNTAKFFGDAFHVQSVGKEADWIRN